MRYYEWTEEMTEQAQNLLNEEGDPKHSEMSYKRYEIDARRNWDIFYKQNQTNFYKDRHYLAREFVELTEALEMAK